MLYSCKDLKLQQPTNTQQTGNLWTTSRGNEAINGVHGRQLGNRLLPNFKTITCVVILAPLLPIITGSTYEHAMFEVMNQVTLVAQRHWSTVGVIGQCVNLQCNLVMV